MNYSDPNHPKHMADWQKEQIADWRDEGRTWADVQEKMREEWHVSLHEQALRRHYKEVRE